MLFSKVIRVDKNYAYLIHSILILIFFGRVLALIRLKIEAANVLITERNFFLIYIFSISISSSLMSSQSIISISFLILLSSSSSFTEIFPFPVFVALTSLTLFVNV